MESTLRFKYHDDCVTNRMKVTRSMRQSCNILVGVATDELDLERGGTVNRAESLCADSGLKSGVQRLLEAGMGYAEVGMNRSKKCFEGDVRNAHITSESEVT